MGASVVLDCSIAMTWCFEDESDPLAERVLDQLWSTEAIVPAIWPLEVANVLVSAERRNRLTPSDSARFLGLLQELPIQVLECPGAAAVAEVVSIAREQGLSAYDASYLHLAMTKGASLATLDGGLQRAAAACGVAVLRPA